MAATLQTATLSQSSFRTRVDISTGATKASRCLSLPKVAPRVVRGAVTVCAQQKETVATHSRRSLVSLVAAAVAAGAVVSDARADALKIKLEGPPPPSGGLPGTENADQARDTDAPLKERFYLQSLSPEEAKKRAKESAAQILAVKGLIDKKAWPYVQNDLRSKAGYLRFDLNTVIAAKPKAEKKALTALANKLYDSIAALDYAARSKSVSDANKKYDETVRLLEDVFAKA